MQIHVLLAATLVLSSAAFASPTKQQDDAAAVSSRNYFGSKNAPYATMRPRSDEDWDDIAQVVCADPCCGEAEQEDGGKGDNCTYPLTLSAIPDTRALTRASLLASTRAQSCIRTKTCVVLGQSARLP